METETEKEWLSVKEFAKRNSVTEDTIRAWCSKGLLATAKRVNRKWFIRHGDFPGVVPPTPATVADDPGIIEARITRELQKVKTETAEDALAERKAQMELQGCIDCEALQKSTAELDADLTRREAKYAEDSVALAEREAELNEVSRQVAAKELAIESAIKFNANWKESYSLYQEIKQCLETLRPRLGYLGYPASIQAGPAAIKKLERIWLKGLHEAK